MPLNIHNNLVQFYSKLSKFYIAGKYTDVAIKCDDETFKCHKVILAAASDYFDAMFCGNFKETTLECIVLQDISAQGFKDVLQFIYSGDMPVDSANVYSLLQLGEFFKLSGIENLCVRFVQENVHKLVINDIWDIFIFAIASGNTRLLSLLNPVIMKQFKAFSRHAKFLEISFASMNELLSKRFWIIDNEDGLFSAIIRWVNHDRENRLQYFHELFQKIRIKDVSSEYMSYLITKLFTELNPMALPDIIEPVKYGFSDTIQGELPYLHILIRCTKTNLIRVFSVSGDKRSFFLSSSDEIIATEYANQWIRNIALDEFYLYTLQYVRRSPTEIVNFNQSFCASSSVLNMKSASFSLKSPPIIFEDISWCRLQNSIYAYNQTLSTQRTPDFTNLITFNSEEIGRGIYQYNYEVDTWFPVPPMVRKQKDSCMLAFNDTLYVLGGAPSERNDPSYSQAYDYRSGRWRLLPNSRYMHIGADCCELNGKIYLVGGDSTVGRFDPVAEKWDYRVPDLNTSSRYHQVVSFSNKIWSMGNFSEGSPSNNLSIQIYDPHENKWEDSLILTDAVQQMYGDKPVSKHFILDSIVFKIL